MMMMLPEVPSALFASKALWNDADDDDAAAPRGPFCSPHFRDDSLPILPLPCLLPSTHRLGGHIDKKRTTTQKQCHWVGAQQISSCVLLALSQNTVNRITKCEQVIKAIPWYVDSKWLQSSRSAMRNKLAVTTCGDKVTSPRKNKLWKIESQSTSYTNIF